MRGWKAVERTIPTGILFDEAVEALEAENFEITQRNTGHVIARRGHKANALSMDNIKLEAAIAESEDGVFFQLRYDTFCLFDTGDLDTLADQLRSAIADRN